MKISKLLLVIVALFAVNSANAFDLKDLKGILSNGTASTILDNIIKTDNVEVADLVGTWHSQAPAVTFKSESLLQKAGGAAAAAAIKKKIQPYYQKAGFDKATFTFTQDGNVTITFKNGKKVTGTVTKGTEKGTMIFNFSKLGSKYGNLKAYVSKGTTLDVSFDGTKLLNLLSAASKVAGTVTGNGLLTGASGIISNCQGMYLGFQFERVN